MTIKNLYPPNRPSVIYNVINGSPELPIANSFTRSSSGTFIDASGILRTVGNNVPRFTYDQDTGEYLGLLLEDASNNRQSNSDLTVSTGSAPVRPRNTTWNNPPVYYYSRYTTASLLPDGSTGPCWGMATNDATLRGASHPSGDPNQWTCSIWVRKPTAAELAEINAAQDPGKLNLVAGKTARIGLRGVNEKQVQVTDKWQRIHFTGRSTYSNADYRNIFWGALDTTTLYNELLMFWGAQFEPSPHISSYIKTPADAAAVTREADSLLLSTIQNFDSGFSLLLDSETTTTSFVYKIKAGNTEIASLTNNNGTLDWEINGKSAAINGEYPQVGFLPGRVRTISSFGQAGQGDVENYLYTTGLSFPTTAEPAAGANKIEFGTPQILKALYVWDGQLDGTNAVSLIKGQYNVVPNEPIDADSYSFVYNIDPSDKGEVTISLPYIVPTVGMTVDWGDGNSNAYAKGLTPSHTYPYPGQYRIQIEASDGFDAYRIGTNASNITRVDQWPKAQQVGAVGSGFTGADLYYILTGQDQNRSIPPFKYSGLTNLDYAFYLNRNLPETADTWDWVPDDLSDVTTAIYTYSSLGTSAGVSQEDFPQATTSDKLKKLTYHFYNSKISSWKVKGGARTFKPFTNTKNVDAWYYTFAAMTITDIDVDTQSAARMDGMFYACREITKMPKLDVKNAINMNSTFRLMDKLTDIDDNWNTSKCEDFGIIFRDCYLLPNMPDWDYSNGKNFSYSFYDCRNMETVPINLNIEKAEDISNAWSNCTKLDNIANAGQTYSFPLVNIPNCTKVGGAWASCEELTNFPPIAFPEVVSFASAWYNTTKLTAFPASLTFPKGVNFDSCWRQTGVINFPAYSFPNAERMVNTWYNCGSMKTFPVIDLPKVTTLAGAWYGCSSLENFPAPTNTDKVTGWANTFFSVPTPAQFSNTVKFDSAISLKSCWKNCTNLKIFPANRFDTTGTLDADAFSEAFKNCALDKVSMKKILESLAVNANKGVNTSVILDISGGTNSPRYAGSSGTAEDGTSWDTATQTAFQALIDKGWTITYNKYAGDIDTATFRVYHGPGVVHLYQGNGTTESGLPNQETFDDESAALARVLELKPDYFPEWDREQFYYVGDLVQLQGSIYRALQANDASDYQLPEKMEIELGLASAEAPSPRNRQARWAEVYDPDDEGLVVE